MVPEQTQGEQPGEEMADYRSWALLKTVKNRYLHVSLLSKRPLKSAGIESIHCEHWNKPNEEHTNKQYGRRLQKF